MGGPAGPGVERCIRCVAWAAGRPAAQPAPSFACMLVTLPSRPCLALPMCANIACPSLPLPARLPACRGLMERGMNQDLSWDNAAQRYEEVLVEAKFQW